MDGKNILCHTDIRLYTVMDKAQYDQLMTKHRSSNQTFSKKRHGVEGI